MSDTHGTTPISSRNLPPAGAGMRCGDVGAVISLTGRGSRALGPAEGPPARPETSLEYLKVSLALWRRVKPYFN